MENGMDIASCDNCSLIIRVLYDVVEDDEWDWRWWMRQKETLQVAMRRIIFQFLIPLPHLWATLTKYARCIPRCTLIYLDYNRYTTIVIHHHVNTLPP
jgi:hypothetical protein